MSINHGSGGDLYVEDDGVNKGNVGIGTTDPQGKLHLKLSNAGELVITNIGGSAANIYNPNGFLVLNSGGAAGTTINDTTGEVVRIEAGNVGIGTTEPQQKLHISGVMRLEPQSITPEGNMGDMYMGIDGNLYLHNGIEWKQVQLVP